MASAITVIGLPIALGIIMFGLGLSLTPGDFARIGRRPKAVAVALACQLILLPLVCFGLVLAFNLPPVLAVGMMLLAASPGGATGVSRWQMASPAGVTRRSTDVNIGRKS